MWMAKTKSVPTQNILFLKIGLRSAAFLGKKGTGEGNGRVGQVLPRGPLPVDDQAESGYRDQHGKDQGNPEKQRAAPRVPWDLAEGDRLVALRQASRKTIKGLIPRVGQHPLRYVFQYSRFTRCNRVPYRELQKPTVEKGVLRRGKVDGRTRRQQLNISRRISGNG
jgi:hypothetical protein